MTEETLFDLLLRTPEAERAALLDRACDGKLELRARVEALLKADAQPAALLAQPVALEAIKGFEATAGYQPAETPGTLIADKYKLLQQIGEGGMGSVWMADQTEPVKRRVAVKLIRTERGSSKTILARFEAERQAIALMDHPNIAKLLDAGNTGSGSRQTSVGTLASSATDGSPFFVMELVKGVPLTEFCDAHRLSIPDRLSLFIQICSAVQHAHQKGIIHRDLKPSNILVELHDDKPVPKVIDFGLAKATSGMQLTENTLFTGFGTVAGTPLYMAPEQANFNAVDIDTRADIYALGVILYELLTGTTPITRETIKKAALDEMMKLIREQEAPTPSSRLSSSETKPAVAANRHSEPQKLGRYIKGELDWIVMKALCKERDRRYETANGFAKDIERFLNHEPVQAGPVSAGYRLKKFVARNKGKVIAASIFLGLLLAGISGTSFGLYQANRAADAERQAKQEAMTAAAAEKTANAQAQARLKQIEKGNAVLTSIFEDLNILEVKEGTEPLEAVLAKRLVKAAEQLDGNAVGDALVVADLQYKLGTTLQSLGFSKEALPLFLKARDTWIGKYGLEDAATLSAMHGLAQVHLQSDNPALAIPLLEENLRLEKKVSGNHHPRTLSQMSNLAVGYVGAGKYDMALPLLKETLKLRKEILGNDHRETLFSMALLTQGYEKTGQIKLSLPLAEETYRLRKEKLGANHPDTFHSLHALAVNLRAAGKYDLALPLYEEAYRLRKLKLGADHPDTLTSANNLALASQAVGKPMSIPFLEETLKFSTRRLGADDPITLRTMANLASAYRFAGKHEQALPLFESTVKLSQDKLGKDHHDTLLYMTYLGEGYTAAGKHDLALPLLQKTLKLSQEVRGLDQFDTIIVMAYLADGYKAAGKFDLAIPHYEEALKLLKEKQGADHPETLKVMSNLGFCCWKSKRLDKSIPVFEENLKNTELTLGRSHRDTVMARYNLGINYKDAGRLAEAIPLLMEVDRDTKGFPNRKEHLTGIFFAYYQADKYQEAAAIIPECLPTARSELPQESPQLAEILVQFSHMYLQARCYTGAMPLLREALAIRERTQPDVWTTFNTKSMLGGALLGLKQYAEAEPLLLTGYEGMKQREKSIPPHGMIRLPQALDRLIQLYTETNKPDEVKKWQAEKEKLPKAVEKKN